MTDINLYISGNSDPVSLEYLEEKIDDHVLQLMGLGQLMEHVLTEVESVISCENQGHIALVRNVVRRIAQELNDNLRPDTTWTEVALQEGFDSALDRLQEGKAKHQ